MAQTKQEPQVVGNDEPQPVDPEPMRYEPEVTPEEAARMAATARDYQTGRVSDPNAPQVVNPMVDQPTEGVTKMSEMFGAAHVVDQVVERPLPTSEASDGIRWFVIRPNADTEDMTVGSPDNHFAFKAGVRYKVPDRVAQIMFDRDLLLEIPFPYQG